MKTDERVNSRPQLEGATPATLGIAVAFMACVGYFIVEHYFTAKEYYAEVPPYLAMFLASMAGVGLVFVLLGRLEPGGANHAAFAVLFGLGIGLAAYSFIPRLNILTDKDGLREYVYTLNSEYVWQPATPALPELHLYLKSSDWWRQYETGDTYTFVLRQGGLGIWLVNMSKIYDDQKRYYDCDGVLSCMTK
jgi:hypothetical protein